MKYLEKTFSMEYGGRKYREGWENTFGAIEDIAAECEICPRCGSIMTYNGVVNTHEMYCCEQCGEARYLMLE